LGLDCRLAVVKAFLFSYQLFKLKILVREYSPMSKWVVNELYVEGNREDLERFKKEAAGENGCLDMNSFIPYPVQFRNQDQIRDLWIHEAITEAELKGEILSEEQRSDYASRLSSAKGAPKDGFNSGGYEWCCENWGTQWNFCDPRLLSETDESLYYEFGTAWSPPIPVILKMGEGFTMLRFELQYFEHGMGFNGILVIEGGQFVMGRVLTSVTGAIYLIRRVCQPHS
jgi:Ferredoxin-like domain in Api92-like protein